MDYEGLRDTAQAELQADGGAVVLKRATASTYDPHTGTLSTGSGPADLTFYAVQMGLTDSYIDGKNREFSDRFHDGTIISDAKLKLFCSAGYVNDDGTVGYDVIPQKNDKVRMQDGTEYVIQQVDPLTPAGVSIAYEITLA